MIVHVIKHHTRSCVTEHYMSLKSKIWITDSGAWHKATFCFLSTVSMKRTPTSPPTNLFQTSGEKSLSIVKTHSPFHILLPGAKSSLTTHAFFPNLHALFLTGLLQYLSNSDLMWQKSPFKKPHILIQKGNTRSKPLKVRQCYLSRCIKLQPSVSSESLLIWSARKCY